MGPQPARRLLLVALVALVGAAAAPAARETTVTVKAAKSAALKTTIVVDGRGLTLYHLTAESGKTIRCSGACAKVWPPLLVPAGAKPRAGAGLLRSKLGTVKRPDGHFQATYAGLALYRYSGDRKAGDANGQGFQQAWFAIKSTGVLVTGGGGGGGYSR